MREHLSTTAVIMSIFVVIAVMFMAPKGFSLSQDPPLVTSTPELTPS
jgi:hypothetical protein